MASTDNIDAIITAAQAAIDKVQASLSESEEFLRAQGVNPQKMRDYANSELTDKQRAEAEAAFRADLEAIEAEVTQAKLHQSFQTPSSRKGGFKPSRTMI